MKILWITILFGTLLLLTSSQPQVNQQEGFAYDPEQGKYPERRYMQPQQENGGGEMMTTNNPYGPGYGEQNNQNNNYNYQTRGFETGVRKEQESGGSITRVNVQTPNVQADVSVVRFWQKSSYERFAKYWEFERKPGWDRCWKYQKNHYYLKKRCSDRPYKDVCIFFNFFDF